MGRAFRVVFLASHGPAFIGCQLFIGQQNEGLLNAKCKGVAAEAGAPVSK